MFTYVLSLIPHTSHSRLIYVTIDATKHIEDNQLPDAWKIVQEKTFSHMYSRIDSVGSVLFVERSSSHRETQEKTLNLAGVLDTTFQNF